MRKVAISRLRKNGFNFHFTVYLVAYTGIEPCWSAAATTAGSQNDLQPGAIPKGFSYIHVTFSALRGWSRIMAILLKFTDFTLSYAELVEELICAKSFVIRQSVDELFTIKKLMVPDACPTALAHATRHPRFRSLFRADTGFPVTSLAPPYPSGIIFPNGFSD